MRQRSFFPVIVKTIRPSPYQTADLKWIATGRDSMQYAIKRLMDGSEIPITEWFCHQLSGAAQIATPGIVVMEFYDTKELAFGSRWEGSLIDAALLNDKDLSRVFVEAKRISAILALDRFICNPDRHLENFLYRQMPDGNTLALAFDYSRAWRIVKEPFGLPFLPTSGKKECATLQTARLASSCNSFDKNEALETIDTVSMLTSDEIRAMLETALSTWIAKKSIDATVHWWDSSEKIERTNLTKDWIKGI